MGCDEEYIKECEPGNNIAVPEQIYNILSKTTARIEYGEKKSTGFFMKINLDKKQHNFLLTCAHCISQNDIDSKITVSIFYGKKNEEKEKQIELDNNKRFIKCFEEQKIDATIIEILSEDDIPDDRYLYPDLNYKNGYEQYIENDIYTGGFPSVEVNKGDRHFSGGKLLKHQINNTQQVIGIHYGSNKLKTHNFGVFIGYIIDFLENSKDSLMFHDKGELKNNDEKLVLKQEDKIKNEKTNDNLNNNENEKINNKENELNINNNKKINEKIIPIKEKENDSKDKIINIYKNKKNNNKEEKKVIEKNVEAKNDKVLSEEEEKLKKVEELHYKEGEKIVLKKPEQDLIVDMLSSGESNDKKEKAISESDMALIAAVYNNPSFIQILKTLSGDKTMLKYLNDYPEIKRLKEKNPIFKESLDKPELMDKLFNPELFNAFSQMSSIINKDKEKKQNNNNIINNNKILLDNNKKDEDINDPIIYEKKFNELKKLGFNNDIAIDEALYLFKGNLEEAKQYLTNLEKEKKEDKN